MNTRVSRLFPVKLFKRFLFILFVVLSIYLFCVQFNKSKDRKSTDTSYSILRLKQNVDHIVDEGNVWILSTIICQSNIDGELWTNICKISSVLLDSQEGLEQFFFIFFKASETFQPTFPNLSFEISYFFITYRLSNFTTKSKRKSARLYSRESK